MPSRPVKFPWYCFTHWISKLSGPFEIHWMRQYLVTVKSNLYIGPVHIFPDFLHCDMTPYLLLKRGPDQQLKYKDSYEVQFFDQYTSPNQSCRRFMQTWNIYFMHLVEVWIKTRSFTNHIQLPYQYKFVTSKSKFIIWVRSRNCGCLQRLPGFAINW